MAGGTARHDAAVTMDGRIGTLTIINLPVAAPHMTGSGQTAFWLTVILKRAAAAVLGRHVNPRRIGPV
jgi:hypothetical protein